MPDFNELEHGKTVRITQHGRTWDHTIWPSTTAIQVGLGDEAVTIDFIDGYPCKCGEADQ